MTTEYRYLSPEDRAAYQRELLRLLSTRNESLAKRWGVDRADRCTALKTALGDFRGVSLSGLREGMEHEFYLAGQELLSTIHKAVKA
jgi:hypothetical protein